MSSVWLPKPIPALVKSYIRRFDREEAVTECAVSKLFRLFPENTALEEVLLKVVALNGLYHTSIFATDKVALRILQCHIDPLLKEGQSKAIDLIARIRLSHGTRTNYAFATKYCSWHNQQAYPIYDSFVDKLVVTSFFAH